MRIDERAFEDVAHDLIPDLHARAVGSEPDDPASCCQEREVAAACEDGCVFDLDLASRDIRAILHREFLVPALQPSSDELVCGKRQAVRESMLADVLQTGGGGNIRSGYGVAKHNQAETVAVDESRQESHVLWISDLRIRVPDNRAVAGPALTVKQVIAVKPLLVEPQNIERHPPGLQERGDNRELAAGLDQFAGRVMPLVPDHKEETVGQRLRGCGHGEGKQQNNRRDRS